MEKGDVPKRLAMALVILTVLISGASTWVLITKSSYVEPFSGINDALVHLNIFKNRAQEQFTSDANSANVKLYISKGG